ncbi:MAG: hypothetical protein CMJ76_16075 [Planctomycetaceae bacterium]|nr:hypothetical protein [Planctomycetaceae bacterium]
MYDCRISFNLTFFHQALSIQNVIAMKTVVIESLCGSTKASIYPDKGFNLYSLSVRNDELLWADPEFLNGTSSCSGSGTPILFPFPGRLNGRSYEYADNKYQLASDDGLGNAIHGFVLDRPWRLIELASDRVTGEFHASIDDPQILEQWPADFKIRCTYSAVENGVNACYEIDNPGKTDLPCGLGTHAYFRVPVGIGDANSAVISCPVSEQWELQNMLCTGEVRTLQEPERPSEGMKFGNLKMDHVFGGITFVDERATASITNPTTGRSLLFRWDATCNFCVIYTPPHREAICMEPYTLVPGGLAFDTGHHGLIVLKPAESFRHEMEILYV